MMIEEDTFENWVPEEHDKTDFERSIMAMSSWEAIPEQSYFCAGGPSSNFPDLSMLAAARQSVEALQPGHFAILQRGGFWHEVLLCLVCGKDQSEWLCCTSSFSKDKIWAAVRFAPGSFVVAQGSAAQRTYMGVDPASIYSIMAGEAMWDLWCPSASEGELLLAEAKLVASQLGAIPPEIYCVSGGMQNFVPSIEDIVRQRVEPAAGKFALIQLSKTWVEVLLCIAVDGSKQWLCLASRDINDQTTEFYWTVVTLEEGRCFVLAGNGSNRLETAYMAQHVENMNKSPESMWLPTPQRIRKALSDAKSVLTQTQSGALKLAEPKNPDQLPALVPP